MVVTHVLSKIVEDGATVDMIIPGAEAGESINIPTVPMGTDGDNPGDPPTEAEANPFPEIVAEQEAGIYAAGELDEPALPPDEPEPDVPEIPPVPGNPDAVITRTGREIVPRVRLIEVGYAGLTQPEANYYNALLEFNCACVDLEEQICPRDGFELYNLSEEFLADDEPNEGDEMGHLGAALGGGFENTSELRPMKYGPAMEGQDKSKWKIAVKEEYDRMVEHSVFWAVPREQVPKYSKIITSTWAMKKKSNGTYRARVNGRGYEQIDGENYDEDSIASPTVNITSFRIVMVLMLMMDGYAHLVDVNGAFLLGGWEKDPVTNQEREVYMEIPEGFHQFFPKADLVLLLLKTIYGTKQAAKRFWLFLLGVFRVLGFEYNRADPCLYLNGLRLVLYSG